MTEAEIKELRAEAARAKQLEAENAKLRAGMDSGEFIPEPISGTFTAEWNAPDGKPVKKKMKFKDGHKNVRIEGGKIVSTIGLMQVANKGKAEEKYLKLTPELANVKQEQAQAWLTKLTKIGYAFLEEA